MLRDTSRVISKFFDSNPNQFEYHLNLNDEDHVFAKIEQIYQGEIVKFDKDDQHVLQKITQLLKIEKFPKNYKNQGFLLSVEVMYYSTVLISKKSFRGFIKNTFFQTFTISTKNHQYKCNLIGVRLSKVISNFLIQNQTADHFIYDFEDDFSEFQIICDIFNFEKAVITVDNIESLKKIAEELQITVLLNEIDQNLYEIDKIAQKINDQQEEMNKIDELFDHLYQINKFTVSKVKQFIIESEWSSSIEKVEELIAFILQVIKTDIKLHPMIADLIIELQNSAQENNKLSILIPAIVQQLMENFGETTFICSFIYKLYKRGIIPQKDIEYEIIKLYSKRHNYIKKSLFSNAIKWFLPEISQMSNIKSKLESQITRFEDYKSSFFKYYYPEKIDKYKEMLESEEPNDRITKFLLHDDVESLQNAIVNEQIDILESFVPYNIYDTFEDYHISYIDYAAAHGSIKCFKYLLLNHAILSNKTFKLAIQSGNEEIIRIVDQRNKSISQNIESKSYFSDIIDSIIIKHQYELFNWVLDEKMQSGWKTPSFFSDISSTSSSNGNAHSLIDIISQAYSFVDPQSIIIRCVETGFLTLFHIIVNIFDISKIDFTKIRSFSDFPQFFTFLTKYMNQNDFEELFKCAAKCNCKMTINHIYENILFKKFNMNVGKDYKNSCLYSILNIFIENHSNDLFFSLVSKIQQYKPAIFKQFSSKIIFNKTNLITEFICSFIYVAIQYKNKEIIEYILIHKSDIDNLFIETVFNEDIEIVKLALKYNCKPRYINQNSYYGTPLHIAVKNSYIQIVELLLTLDCIDPNIGTLDYGDTPLMIALENNIYIVNLLINHPKIDINVKNRKGKDAFAIAQKYNRYKAYKYFADKGNAEAMFCYAYRLYKGEGFPINKEEAFKYYKMSANKGYSSAMVNCANMLQNGDGVPVNNEEAVKYFKMAIDKGHPSAMFNYALILKRGDGVPVNNEEAIKYFKMAIDKGSSSAMLFYSTMLEKGDGVPINKEEALKYLKMAADNENSGAMNKYANLIYKDDADITYNKEALKYFKMAADRGISDAMNNYAFILLTKSNPEKYEESCCYFRKAIIRNSPYSMVNYGFMLDFGLGTPVNHTEANKLYNKVIKLGEVEVIFKFAKILEKGIGIFQISKSESCRYYKMAADAGYIDAIYKYANMLENGIFIESNIEEAIKYYKIASEKGNAEAEKDY